MLTAAGEMSFLPLAHCFTQSYSHVDISQVPSSITMGRAVLLFGKICPCSSIYICMPSRAPTGRATSVTGKMHMILSATWEQKAEASHGLATTGLLTSAMTYREKSTDYITLPTAKPRGDEGSATKIQHMPAQT